MNSDPVRVVGRLARVLESLGIPYVIGGSFASSLYGVPRATQDVDIVADIRPDQEGAFAAALPDDFHVDPGVIREAIAYRSSFNILHLPTMFKADVFISPEDAWSRERLTRAREENMQTPDGEVRVRFSSPEDTLLYKLVWYRRGGEQSGRQWEDVVGMIRVQRDRLDVAYMERWAPGLGVEDLLKKAQGEARQ